jgi:hypothetical protein
MRNYRFGRKLVLPSTTAIKHQFRMLTALEVKKAEDERTTEVVPAPPSIAVAVPMLVAEINARVSTKLVI